jgi:hypothetical protein
MKSTIISVLALAAYASAQAQINTPTSLVQCQPSILRESALFPMFFFYITAWPCLVPYLIQRQDYLILTLSIYPLPSLVPRPRPHSQLLKNKNKPLLADAFNTPHHLVRSAQCDDWQRLNNNRMGWRSWTLLHLSFTRWTSFSRSFREHWYFPNRTILLHLVSPIGLYSLLVGSKTLVKGSATRGDEVPRI